MPIRRLLGEPAPYGAGEDDTSPCDPAHLCHVGRPDADGQSERLLHAVVALRRPAGRATTPPRGTGAGGAPGAVDVRGCVLGRIEVHHCADIVDVDAASGDVGGDECLDLAVGEGLQGPVSLGLAAAAVDGSRLDAELADLAGETICSMAGTGEHDRRADRIDELRGVGHAFAAVDVPEQMVREGHVGLAGADLVARRIRSGSHG